MQEISRQAHLLLLVSPEILSYMNLVTLGIGHLVGWFVVWLVVIQKLSLVSVSLLYLRQYQ